METVEERIANALAVTVLHRRRAHTIVLWNDSSSRGRKCNSRKWRIADTHPEKSLRALVKL